MTLNDLKMTFKDNERLKKTEQVEIKVKSNKVKNLISMMAHLFFYLT